MASPADYSASRKRTTLRQHSVEDQALSQVAKEVSRSWVTMLKLKGTEAVVV